VAPSGEKRTVYLAAAGDIDALFEAVEAERAADVVVMAAAVADFRPKLAAPGKIKKHEGVPDIVLEPTPDILAGLGAAKSPGQVLVGFAAETDDLLANATAKLVAKRLDLIVANDVAAPGVGFGHDTNAVTLLRPDADPITVDLRDKRAIARVVVDVIVDIRRAADPTIPIS
jgi:phosphopantothenoylcysteine decarboxylase/phosphopantothenate--cysteine ligase